MHELERITKVDVARGATFIDVTSFQGEVENEAMEDAGYCDLECGKEVRYRVGRSRRHLFADGSVLIFENLPLSLTVIEPAADPVVIQVRENATPVEVREEFCRMIHESLLPLDRLSVCGSVGSGMRAAAAESAAVNGIGSVQPRSLIHNGVGTFELEEDVPLFRQGVRTGAVLRLHRTSPDRIHRYVCECGELVELKRVDVISCQSCGYNIVYKLENRKPRVYLAR